MYCIVTVVRFVIILIKFYVCMYVLFLLPPVAQCVYSSSVSSAGLNSDDRPIRVQQSV